MRRTKNSDGRRHEEIDEAEVKQYLESNPDFLERNSDVLQRLSISHQTGAAVSLVEKQISVLRNKISEQNKEREDLLTVAENNWLYIVRLNRLAKELLGKNTIREIFEVITERMKRDFEADETVMEILDDREKITTFGSVSGLMELFDLCDEDNPLSGPVRKEHKDVLSGSAETIKSQVTIPMKSGNWKGILVIGSVHLGRYEGGGRIELLSHLRDLIVLAIDPLLRTDG